MKESILRAYELVPEAYRQKFRNHKRSNGQMQSLHEKKEFSLINGAANEVKENFVSSPVNLVRRC